MFEIVLKNNKIGVHVAIAAIVDMVHYGFGRQRVPDSAFSDRDVFVLPPVAART